MIIIRPPTPKAVSRSRRLIAVLASLASVVASTALRAQSSIEPAATTPEALAARVSEVFESGDSASFAAIFPFAAGRDLVSDAVRRGASLHAGLATVLTREPDHAILLLSGYASRGHAGVETLLSKAYSDFYRAERRGSSWVLAERLPLDAESRIHSHRLDVTVTPGEGLRVTDAFVVSVTGGRGFAARLNREATLLRATVDGQRVEPLFAAGLLWVPVPEGRTATLVLDYTLDIPHDPDSYLSYFLPASGFIRDQSLWHPVLNYGTSADRATFDVTARIPAPFHLSTSIAQQVRIEGASRLVTARTDAAVAGITLAYDQAWEPYVIEGPALRVEAFVSPEFQPTRAALDSAVRRTYGVLEALYGAPRAGDYLAIVQRREAGSSGWHMLSNAAIIAGRNGRAPTMAGQTPRAFVGHELAHRWTAPTGPGALLLSEGWATFAESFILADEYGPEVERRFWESQRLAYERGGFEGKTSITADDANSGISYSKGAWILRMLRDDLGPEVFDRGVRAYVAIPPGSDAGVAEFARALSAASGRDVAAWLRPWVDGRTIPSVRAEVTAGGIVIRQDDPVFDLPVEIEIIEGSGRTRRSLRVSGSEVRLALPAGSAVREVVVDPDGKLLLRR